MSVKYLKLRTRYGALYGLVAGLAYAFFTWFLDAVGLASANAAYPFVKLIGGMIITLPFFLHISIAWFIIDSEEEAAVIMTASAP